MDLLAKYTRVGPALLPSEEDQCVILAELLRTYLKHRAEALIRAHSHDAVLVSYCSDATPMLLDATATRTWGTSLVYRKGKVFAELLMQRTLVRAPSKEGGKLAFVFDYPRPLSQGKSAWHLFTCACEHFPLSRALGHQAISIYHFASDRLPFSSLARKLSARCEAYYDPAVGACSGADRGLLHLTHWFVATPCAAHDINNGLKWSLNPCLTKADLVSDLYLCTKGLRNSYTLLHRHLLGHIMELLQYRDVPLNPDEVQCFWSALGVESSRLSDLIALDPWFSDGVLWVNPVQATPGQDPLEQVTGCLFYLFHFVPFTESRFLGVGKSSRQLLAASAVGLQALVSRVQSDPHASQYHLQSFSRCDEHVMRYAVVAGVSSFGLDSLMSLVLEDDRLCAQVSNIRDILVNELTWIEDLPDLCWHRLASMVGARCLPLSLRNAVLTSMHIGCGYVDQKLLQPLSSPPWSLAHGDHNAGLEALTSENIQTVDDCSWKIKQLLEVGYDKQKIRSGLNMLLEVSWSSLAVEQAHGSAAVLHRYHPQYGCPFLASRTLVHISVATCWETRTSAKPFYVSNAGFRKWRRRCPVESQADSSSSRLCPPNFPRLARHPRRFRGVQTSRKIS